MTAAIAPATFVPGPRSIESPVLLNLLILDAERTVREASKQAALILGYRTSASESAEQTLRLLDSQSIDVVLLDLNSRALEARKCCATSSSGGRISRPLWLQARVRLNRPSRR